MAGSLLCIIAGTYMLYYFILQKSLPRAISLGIAGTLIMHLPQLPKSLKVARPKNLLLFRIVIKTILFGATWWKPLEKGVIDR